MTRAEKIRKEIDGVLTEINHNIPLKYEFDIPDVLDKLMSRIEPLLDEPERREKPDQDCNKCVNHLTSVCYQKCEYDGWTKSLWKPQPPEEK